MNIGGALGIIGSAPVKDYSWGSTVVAIVNSHRPPDQKVTGEETGTRMAEIILQFEPAVVNAVLAIDIGPLEGSIPLNTHTRWTQGTWLVAAAVALTILALILTSINSYTDPNAPSSESLNSQIFGFLIEVIRALLNIPAAPSG